MKLTLKPAAAAAVLVMGASILGAGAVILPATPAAAEAMSNCVYLENGSLVNRCGVTVEVVWCTENIDCNNGRFTNSWTISAGGSYPVNGGNSGNTVHWGACRGKNTLSTRDTSAYSWTFYCTD